MKYTIAEKTEANIRKKLNALDKWREENADSITSREELSKVSTEFIETYKAKRREYLELAGELNYILTQKI